jgi:hypothetical protein
VLMQNQAISGNSLAFSIKRPIDYRSPNNQPLLGISGTMGTAQFTLQWFDPVNEVWLAANEPVLLPNKLGLYKLPVNSAVKLRLNYVAGGGSSITVVVFDGVIQI